MSKLCLSIFCFLLLLLVVEAKCFDEALASRVCRPGPPLAAPKDGRKNCLIIGDSISLGYTPIVQQLLNTSCQVQHAPYSGDGGALDTKYALQCLDLWLVTSQMAVTHYDAIIINSGLHDANYSGRYPEEFTPMDDYSRNLGAIREKLLAALDSTRLGFATTTPVGYNKNLNDLVIQYNEAAKSAMATSSMFDLYATVISKCGQPPYNCSIQDEEGVHFHPEGYQLLAHVVANGFTSLLKGQEDAHFSRKLPVGTPLEGVACPGGTTLCPANATCVKDSFSRTGFGCCLTSSLPGQDCGDSWHCCPHGMTCQRGCNMFGCSCASN